MKSADWLTPILSPSIIHAVRMAKQLATFDLEENPFPECFSVEQPRGSSDDGMLCKMSLSASASGSVPVPLIMPKTRTIAPSNSGSSVNIFKMILNDGHRSKQAQPVIDLESEASVIREQSIAQEPVPKKRRDLKEEEGEVSDSDSMPSIICVGEDFESERSGRRETSPSVLEEVIDLTVEEKRKKKKVPTLRDVLKNLCNSDELEDGEIVEDRDEPVIDLTSDDLSLTLRSQVEADVIDLTAEAEVAEESQVLQESSSEVICVEDLTLIDDEEEVSIVKSSSPEKRRRKSKKMSIRASLCADIKRKPSKDDALSKASHDLHGTSARFYETFTAAPTPSSSNMEFRVCCYNVLCQLTTLKTSYLYGHLRGDDRALRWEHRWPLLEEELIRLNADIYGLQEVQFDHYDTCFRASMSRVGYVSFYKKRTGVMYDGCAVFVRRTKFDVVSYRVVEYFVAANSSMDRDQIGQILRLRCKKTGQELVYANTHLIYNSARGDIKIGQLAMLFANINDELSKSPCPLIINGDFNIEPMSYVYTYISESSVYLRGLPRNELSGQGERGGPCVQADNILPSSANIGRNSVFVSEKSPQEAVAKDFFTHPFRLASVYHHFSEHGEKEVSTFHKQVANPDFIFYSVEKKKTVDTSTQVFESKELHLLRRLSLPGLATVGTLGPWPNLYVPSDHIPLVADFVLTKASK